MSDSVWVLGKICTWRLWSIWSIQCRGSCPSSCESIGRITVSEVLTYKIPSHMGWNEKIYLEDVVVQPLDEVGPVIPLRDELLVLRDEFSLAAPDPLHVRLQLLDLVYLALPTVASCHLIDYCKDSFTL